MICYWCTNAHVDNCEDRPRAADLPDGIRHELFEATSDDEPTIGGTATPPAVQVVDSSSDDDLESKALWTNLGNDEGEPALIGETASTQMKAGWMSLDFTPATQKHAGGMGGDQPLPTQEPVQQPHRNRHQQQQQQQQ